MRDNGKRGLIVPGLTEHEVSSLDQVAALLSAGAMNRATAATCMNAQSSRSHAMCTLRMEQFSSEGAFQKKRVTGFDCIGGWVVFLMSAFETHMN